MRPWRNPRPEPIPGLALYTVDGNALAGTHHRLADLRDSTAAALPGMSVCVLEQATGRVSEQEVRVGPGADARVYRCVEVHLKKPTRDGETVIRLLTNLSASQASALQVAEVYRERWQIETGFQQLTDYLRCEVESLVGVTQLVTDVHQVGRPGRE